MYFYFILISLTFSKVCAYYKHWIYLKYLNILIKNQQLFFKKYIDNCLSSSLKCKFNNKQDTFIVMIAFDRVFTLAVRKNIMFQIKL